MYNLEQLKMFVTTAETGSFSACARQLGKVQSAVSQGIANLELDLNTQLFDRSTRKPCLTPAGSRLLEYAKAVLHQNHEFHSAALALAHEHEPNLTLALDSALILPRFNEILQAFSQRFAHTNLKLLNLPGPAVLDHVAKGQAHMGLMFADSGFVMHVELCYIGNLAFYGVCHKDSALAKLSQVTPKDLLSVRQIIANSTLFPPLGAHNWMCNNFSDVKALLMQNLGWAYMPEHLIHHALKDGELVKLTLSFDHKPWNPPIDRIMQKNQAPGPALQWLADEVTRLLN